MRPMDRRIRPDEHKGGTKPQICEGYCTEMDRRENTSKDSSKQ